MKRIILLAIVSLVFFNACQKKSDKEILDETISALEKIETVRYSSKLEIRDKGKIIISDSSNLFFDFTDTNTANGLKYHFQDERGELIFNGKESIQSDNENRVILTDQNPNTLNPLIATLYPLKEILPQLIDDENILITRKSDSIIFGQEHYVFSFVIQQGYIDWMELGLKYVIDYNTEFTLITDKSNFLPKIIIGQNGKDGTLSRTVENVNLDVQPKKGLWEGSNLPPDYARYGEDEYYAGFKNKLASYVGKKIDDWELPILTDSQKVNPSKLKGDVILLEFWFENCGWCIKAIPGLNEINSKYANKSFKMYGIEFIKEDEKDRLKKFVDTKKMEYPSLYNGKSIATKYGIRTTPTFLIIDKNGTIIYAQSSFKKEEIIDLIEKNI